VALAEEGGREGLGRRATSRRHVGKAAAGGGCNIQVIRNIDTRL
jgi:hypothetical protein